MTTIDQKGRLQPSPDTKMLLKLLRGVEPGKTVMYTDLSGGLGKLVTSTNSNLASARRILERDGITFKALPNLGLRRNTETQVVGDWLPSRRKRMGKQAKRAVRAGSQQDLTKLSKPDQVLLAANVFVAGQIEKSVSDKGVKEVAGAKEQSDKQLLAARKSIGLD